MKDVRERAGVPERRSGPPGFEALSQHGLGPRTPTTPTAHRPYLFLQRRENLYPDPKQSEPCDSESGPDTLSTRCLCRSVCATTSEYFTSYRVLLSEYGFVSSGMMLCNL